MRWRISPAVGLDLIATIALVLASGVVVWTHLRASPTSAVRRSLPIPSQSLDMRGVSAIGSQSAPAGLVVFSDFQCPFCSRFARETMPLLDQEYVRSGKLRVVFRHFPLAMHPAAGDAAKAAECGGQQGKFWAIHDRLFLGNPSEMDQKQIRAAVEGAGVDMPRFESCDARGASAQVAQDVELGKKLGVSGTPAFFIGTMLPTGELRVSRAIPGVAPIEDFRKAVDASLGKRAP